MSKTGMLGKLPLSAVRGPRDTLEELLAGSNGPAVLEDLKRFNRETHGEHSKLARPKPPKILIPTAKFTTEALSERFDPKAFFKSGDHLFIWNDFEKFIIPAAKVMEPGAIFDKVRLFTLGRDATGVDLQAARPKSLWEDAGEFCCWFATKLTKQRAGQAGELDNSGKVILALVKGVNGAVFVVNVYWSLGGRSWNVSAYGLSSRWSAGRQFISRS